MINKYGIKITLEQPTGYTGQLQRQPGPQDVRELQPRVSKVAPTGNGEGAPLNDYPSGKLAADYTNGLDTRRPMTSTERNQKKRAKAARHRARKTGCN